MRAENRAEEVVRGMMAKDAFSQWLGIEVLEVSDGAATVRMTIRPEMVNGFGVCHGGISYSLADSAFAFASNSHGRVAMSIDNTMSYPERVEVGDVLTAVASELKVGEKIGMYEVSVTNQRDVLVGIFRGTVYRTGKEHPKE